MIARAIAAAALLATTLRPGGADADAGASGADGAAPAPPATTPDVRPNRRPEAVDITFVGSGDAYDGLRTRLGDHMPSGVPLLWNRIDRFNPLTELLRGPPVPRPVSALRCWIDLADLHHATLYFADQRGERFLVRELPLSGRFDEVDQQSVAQVMELSVSALIENAEIGFSREQAREILARAQQPSAPVIAASAPPGEPAGWHLEAGVFYALEGLGAALPFAQGPGLILALGRMQARPTIRRLEPGLGAWLTGQYQLPMQARETDVGMRLETLGARAGIERRWWRLQGRLGAGANFTHVTPQPGSATAGLVLSAPHWSTSFVATVAVAMSLPLEKLFGPVLGLSLTLFVDFAPSTTDYRFADASGTHLAFAPSRLRPGLALELVY